MWLFRKPKEKQYKHPLELKPEECNFPIDVFGRDDAVLKEAVSFVKPFTKDQSVLLDLALDEFPRMKHMYNYHKHRFDLLLDMFMDKDTLYTLRLLDVMYEGRHWGILEWITKDMKRSPKTLSLWLKDLEEEQLVRKSGDTYILTEKGRKQFPPQLQIAKGFLAFFVVANHILKKKPDAFDIEEFLKSMFELIKVGIYSDLHGILSERNIAKYNRFNFIMFRTILVATALEQEPLKEKGVAFFENKLLESDKVVKKLLETQESLQRL